MPNHVALELQTDAILYETRRAEEGQCCSRTSNCAESSFFSATLDSSHQSKSDRTLAHLSILVFDSIYALADSTGRIDPYV